MSKNYPSDNSRDLLFETIAQQLPDDHGILDAAYSALIELNCACLAGNDERRDAAANQFEACIWKLNGKSFFGCSAGEHESAHVISEYCRAEGGSVPIWGQHGDFIIETEGGLRARVKTESGCLMGFLSASFHVVDLGAPFVSETGFRSYIFQFSEVLPGETVDAHVLRVFQSLIAARKKPVFLDADHRDNLAAETLPEWMKRITPHADRTPQKLPDGFVRIQAVLPASKAFIARKWSTETQDRIADILQLAQSQRLAELKLESERKNQQPKPHKEYKDRLVTVERYREFYVGARCEVVQVHHPVFAKNIGTIIKIVTIYDSGTIVAHDDKPPRTRYNRRGRLVVEYDPTCIRSSYSADDLKLIEESENKNG
jgi:hypothetical protein